jgi:NTP pyrophosphatase (non-canonical NTP hydrolase)
MNLTELQKEIFEINRANGWHEDERRPLEYHALITSEVAEATECVRSGEDEYWFRDTKPEGEAYEIADVIIRCLDYAESREWNMSELIKAKLEYNKTRGHRHGNKTI